MNKEVDKYDENNKQIQPENNNYVDDSKDIIDNNIDKNDNSNNHVVKQSNDNDNINSNNNTVNNTDSDIDKNNDKKKNNDINNKKIEKIFISQKFEDDQEIVNNGIEVPNDSPSNFIKILKKDKHGEPLPNISYDYLFKVSLIGDSATGKTSIMLRFIDDFFTEDTKSTIGVDFKLVSLELANNIYAKMQIWDTCGSERFKSLTSSFIKTCSAFILVFDLTRVSTFKNIDNWIKIIKENTSPKFLILIGNKSDLVENRAIEKDIILDYCQKHLFNYFEISAKNNLNIEKMFKEVAYQLYMDIKKKENNNVKSVGYVGNFSNIQVNMDNQKKKKSCCS